MNEYKKLLKNHGLIVTKGRTHALEILKNSGVPLNVEEVFQKVDRKLVPNFTSLYRILNQLFEAGLLNKTIHQDGINYYEFKSPHHKHFIVCKICGTISEIKHCPMETFEKEVSEETGFTVEGHNVELQGICPKCQKDTNKI